MMVSIAALGFAEVRVRREVGARKREDDRRDEELALLRRQVSGEEEDRSLARQAKLIGFQGSTSGGEHADEFSVSILNSGPDLAREVRSWAVNDSGETVSDTQNLGALPANAPKPQEFKLSSTRPHGRRGASALYLRASWIDGSGSREENLVDLGLL
jgi:hypothetical protein